MFDGIRAWLLRTLRVPPEPRPPAGERHVLRIFRAAPNYWRYKVVLWAGKQLGALVGVIGGLIFANTVLSNIAVESVQYLVMAGELLAISIFIVQLPLSFALLRLDFDMRWYILTDRSMHIREGTLHLHEKTITFANIQNISIAQNPLQRLLGLYDVNVRTAGGGEAKPTERHGSFGGMHEAIFHGVNNAEEIRDAIRERIRLQRDAGLGDTDDDASVEARPVASDAVLAAQDVLAEVRALRAAF